MKQTLVFIITSLLFAEEKPTPDKLALTEFQLAAAWAQNTLLQIKLIEERHTTLLNDKKRQDADLAAKWQELFKKSGVDPANWDLNIASGQFVRKEGKK